MRFLQSLLFWCLGILILAAAVHAATVFALPGFAFERTMARLSRDVGVNAAFHAPRIDGQSRALAHPSPDLIYSGCAFNLTQSNLRITGPIPAEGYWSLTLIGAGGEAFFTQTNKGVAEAASLSLLLARPGAYMDATGGDGVVSAPSFKGLVIVRRLIDDTADFAAIDTERRRFECTPTAR